MKIRNVFRLKFLLFLPVAALITVSLGFVSFLLIRNSISSIKEQNKENLQHQVQTLSKMFEREHRVKTEKIKSNLYFANHYFYTESIRFSNETYTQDVWNQVSKSTHETTLNKWFRGADLINENNALIDSAIAMFGGTMTIFQRSDSGYVRIATNVPNKDGVRAINTYIPHSSEVCQTVSSGETYFGRAFVVNDWYITAYEPIFKKDSVVGMLYVGDSEKDLDALAGILEKVHIGQSSQALVFDKNGTLIIGDTNYTDIFQYIKEAKEPVSFEFHGSTQTAAAEYFEEFEFYICIVQDDAAETRPLIRKMVISAVIIIIIALAILLIMLYFFTFERFYRYVVELKKSRSALKSTEKALQESEDRFSKLFDSTGDAIFVTNVHEDIIEVNQAACTVLGYTREELLKKKMQDIKNDVYRPLVSANRQKIYELGIYTFESVHVNKDGLEIPVEITSRVIDYKTEKLILSIARNIGTRKESEREILSTVIRVEERERERFAKEMHDGLGPLLSTVKLYVNELGSSTLEEKERKDFVNYVNELIDDSIIDIKSIANNLVPRVIHQYGLVKAVESFCEKVNNANSVDISFKTEKCEQRLDHNTELIFFRIISELINNTLKHANAKNVDITLKKESGKLQLIFKDNGIGFDAKAIMNSEQKGMGLKNIVSRIRSINGVYKIESSPGKGFEIQIEIEAL
jgi:PAS domain S-box-containing protein